MKTLGLILLAIFTIVSWEIGPTIMPPAWEWYSNCWNQKQPDGIAVIVQLCSIFYGFFGFTVSFLFSYICIKDKNSVFGLVKECINKEGFRIYMILLTLVVPIMLLGQFWVYLYWLGNIKLKPVKEDTKSTTKG